MKTQKKSVRIWRHWPEAHRNERKSEFPALRALSLAWPGDVVLVPESALPKAQQLQTHLLLAGLAEGVSLRTKWEDTWAGHELEVRSFGEEANALAPNPALLAATLELENKNRFLERAKGNGWPIPRTEAIPKEAWGAHAYVLRIGYPRVIKTAVGSSVFVCLSPEQASPVLNQLRGRDFQIQEFLNGAVFYSVHLAYGEVTVLKRLGVGTTYAGAIPERNQAVTRRIVECCKPAILAVCDHTIPVLSFDVAVRGMAVFLLGCNPGYTKTSYPYLVARRLGLKDSNWEYQRLAVPTKTIKLEKVADLVLKPGGRTGVIVLDLVGSPGKLGILLVGHDQQRAQLLQQCRSLLA